MMTRAAAPAAIPAMAGVLNWIGSFFDVFTNEGSTMVMTLLEKTEPLTPRRSVVFGLCSQLASKATKAILC